jgi:hypothetical protein|tara:strand:+ start:695 stop:922 length:228 start_codon:yes stop_codon:yes gene_type:complete
MIEVKKCLCGNNNYHSGECRHRKKLDYLNKRKREERKKLRLELKCIWCKKKVKPIIVYPQYCEDHKPKKKEVKND